MNEVRSNYYAYMLRFRRNGSPLRWRISLLDIHGDQNLYFNKLADFIDFVQSHFAEQEGVIEASLVSEQGSEDEQI